jgi:hypothetical protein
MFFWCIMPCSLVNSSSYFRFHVKLSLCLIKHNSVKTYGCNDGIALLIHNLDIMLKSVVSFMLQPLCLSRNNHCIEWVRASAVPEPTWTLRRREKIYWESNHVSLIVWPLVRLLYQLIYPDVSLS